MKPILEVHNLSKKFRIISQADGYLSLRERMLSIMRFERKSREDFWALRNVSFQVNSGESIGIIGRNGAGKSTILKILSKITPPTMGRIVTRGRIASLLEVGTGFHPELTGRENIFFNGSLMGMKRREITQKFDQIVDFSGVEKFLESPLKHYSSGMQLRLAFAVAAFLEPEILVIDEVLAVGDAEFQKKCIGKMENVTKSGRTILFVSHNMGMVKQLCQESVWIDRGEVVMTGDTEKVTNAYLFRSSTIENLRNVHDLGNGVTIPSIIVDQNPIKSLTDLNITFEMETERSMTINSIGFFLNNLREERLGIFDLRKEIYKLGPGERLTINMNWRKIPLIEGEYRIGLFLGSNIVEGNFHDLINFQVVSPQRKTEILEYPIEVRGKLEFDYDFYAKKN